MYGGLFLLAKLFLLNGFQEYLFPVVFLHELIAVFNRDLFLNLNLFK